ncbi:MAG: hypothetical protein J5950_07200 [Clostridia bacterium]|nr:hypothetical protein [Clostridia bacterium]
MKDPTGKIDLRPETWVCTDGLQRSIDPDKYPALRKDRKVGMFYFIWHDHRPGAPLVDHTRSYEEGGLEKVKADALDAPMGFLQYWAEPYFGYYRSDDPWILRKHASMLTAAGVDFIFLDVTNALTYHETYNMIFRVWSEMRSEDQKTPDVMFITNTHAAATVEKLYNELYKTGNYSDMWFMYQGKPLILVPDEDTAKLPDEIRDFFTIRHSWAYTKGGDGNWYVKHDGKNCWPWADMFPQNPGLDKDGNLEQMIVMCGFWVNGSYGTNGGRSYHGGRQPDNIERGDMGFGLSKGSAGEGYAFDEQFGRALETDPPILMITGWNEWTAGRWGSAPGTLNNPANGQTIANSYKVIPGSGFNDYYFVDNFNGEFSRDLEPVKGLFEDNYYCQLSDLVRKYKGAAKQEPVKGCVKMDIEDSDPSEWDNVSPEYFDAPYDTLHRNWAGNGGNTHYVNTSGRNDIVSMKVCADRQYIYFMCRCREKITSPEGTNWMNLYLNSDCKFQNGWNGFDYIINRHQSGGNASIEVFIDNEWKFEQIGEAMLRVTGDVLELKVPRALVRLNKVFDFKWADNSVDDGDIMKFYDMGDTAPDGRFCYRCVLEE